MSIEKLMQELIDALDRNTAALGTSKAPETKDAEKPVKVSVSVSAPAPTPSEAPEAEAPEAEAPEAEAPEAEAPQWPEIVSAFRCFIARHGTTEAVKIMGYFGVKGKLTEDQLPVARYAEFLQAMKSHGE